MTQLPYPPVPVVRPRSTGRLVSGIVLAVIGALLTLIAVVATVQAIDGSDRQDADGIPVIWVFALVPLFVAWRLLRRRSMPVAPPQPNAPFPTGSYPAAPYPAVAYPAAPTFAAPGVTDASAPVGYAGPRHRPIHVVVGVLMLLAAGALLVVAVISIVGLFTGSVHDIRGLGFVFGIGLVLMRFGLINLRRTTLPTPTGSRPVSPATGAMYVGPSGPPPAYAPQASASPGYSPTVGTPMAAAVDPARGGRYVDRGVRYLQLACQVSPVPTLIAALLMAGGIWVLTIAPMHENGPIGFLVFLPVIPGFYLFAVLLYLPYRISLRNGVLSMGVAGVPRIGRAWRELKVDLADVTSWEVRPARHDRTRTGNNLRGPGGRWLLIVHTDESAVRGRAFPDHVMVGYAVLSAASVGYVAGGPIEIRARRAKPLREALERALPGGT